MGLFCRSGLSPGPLSLPPGLSVRALPRSCSSPSCWSLRPGPAVTDPLHYVLVTNQSHVTFKTTGVFNSKLYYQLYLAMIYRCYSRRENILLPSPQPRAHLRELLPILFKQFFSCSCCSLSDWLAALKDPFPSTDHSYLLERLAR